MNAVTKIGDEGREVFLQICLSIFVVFALRTRGLHFSRDPLAALRPWLQQHSKFVQSGFSIVPVFGAGTANSEFEFLTAMSMRLVPDGMIPYVHYIKRSPIPSVGGVLKYFGYQTTAVHNYHRAFYRRDRVYPLIGFQNFFGLEDLDYEDSKEEWRPRDDILANKVLQILQKEETKPQFVFSVTVGAHGPYGRIRDFGVKPFQIQGVKNTSLESQLSNYSILLEDSAKNIEKIVDYVMKRKKKTLLVIFGDHLPALHEIFGVLPWPEGSPENRLRRTNYLVISNYEQKFSLPPALSLPCMSALLLPLMNRENTPFRTYVSETCQKEAYNLDNLAKSGAYEKYRMLMFDRLFGKKFSGLNQLYRVSATAEKSTF